MLFQIVLSIWKLTSFTDIVKSYFKFCLVMCTGKSVLKSKFIKAFGVYEQSESTSVRHQASIIRPVSFLKLKCGLKFKITSILSIL